MDISQQVWPPVAYTVGAAAWFCAVLLVLTKPLHGHFTAGLLRNVQSAHTMPTPRIGGLALYFSVVLGTWLCQGEMRHILMQLVLAGTPAFAFGLLEDCTHRVSVRTRLFATIGSGILASMITGLTIGDINVPWLNTLLEWTPFAVLFTAFAVSGVANAFNIIDGFNGLASGTAVITLGAFAWLDLQLGASTLSAVCLILAAAALGFMLVNWPRGKLFMGDGGAYFLGFGVAWMAVLLLHRYPQVSAWCPLLICSYPVLEVVFSMLRRRLRRRGLGTADRLHLHSLVKRRVVRQLCPTLSRTTRNSTTGALLWGMTLLPALWAVSAYDNMPLLALGLLLFAAAYHLLYVRLVRFRWCISAALTPAPKLSKAP